MTRTERIKSRAFRILKGLSNYHEMTGEKIQTPFYFQYPPIQGDEICIGMYENYPGQIDESILVTNHGLYIYRQQEWQFISFYKIKQILIPSNKHTTAVDILTTDKETIEIPVKGRGVTGKELDALAFWRFLHRVINKDIKYQ